STMTSHIIVIIFFFSSRRRHTILVSDWSSDVCSSDLSWVYSWVMQISRDFLGFPTINPGSLTTLFQVEYLMPQFSQTKQILHFEIGRASCREREEILVGAELLRNRISHIMEVYIH